MKTWLTVLSTAFLSVAFFFPMTALSNVRERSVSPFFSEVLGVPQIKMVESILNDVHVGVCGLYDVAERKSPAPGVLGPACKANVFGDVSRIESLYDGLILKQDLHLKQGDDVYKAHRNEYVKNIASLIREVTYLVMDRRFGDKMSKEEKENFLKSVYAKAWQESFFVHYRKKYRPVENSAIAHPMLLVVGDKNQRNIYNARGIMQINNLYHQLPFGIDYDLVKNIAYGASYYLSVWKNVETLSCLKQAKRDHERADPARYWKRRAQIAYAAYNGGMNGGVCKRMNVSDRTAACRSVSCHNDRGYLEKYEGLDGETSYAKAVRNSKSVKINVDVKAILDGNDMKALASGARSNPFQLTSERHNQVVFFGDGSVCKFNRHRQGFDCAKSANKEGRCLLRSAGSQFIFVENMEKAASFGGWLRGIETARWVSSPNQFCPDHNDRLFSVGDFVRVNMGTKKNGTPQTIVMRTSRGSNSGREVSDGEVYQVLDFDFYKDSRGGSARRYKLKKGKTVAYVHGGNNSDENSSRYFYRWLGPVQFDNLTSQEKKGLEVIVPRRGHDITVINPKGLPYRLFKRGNTELPEDQRTTEGTLSAGEVVFATNVNVRGAGHEIWVEFIRDNKVMEFYAGMTGGANTSILENVKVSPEKGVPPAEAEHHVLGAADNSRGNFTIHSQNRARVLTSGQPSGGNPAPSSGAVRVLIPSGNRGAVHSGSVNRTRQLHNGGEK